MTKEHHRSEERGAAIQDKPRATKAAEAADAPTHVAIAKPELPAGTEAQDTKKWAPAAWFAPLRASWKDIVHRSTARPVRVDVISRTDDILVRAEVPGISKDRLELAITADTLTIFGQASVVEAGTYIKRELPSGEFSRRIALPVEIQAQQASATMHHGLLEIVLPKSNRDRAQKIAIR